METIQFRTKIKDDVIRIPAQYKGKFKNGVRVILIADEEDNRTTDIIEKLMAQPLKIQNFHPLTREQSHARK